MGLGGLVRVSVVGGGGALIQVRGSLRYVGHILLGSVSQEILRQKRSEETCCNVYLHFQRHC